MHTRRLIWVLVEVGGSGDGDGVAESDRAVRCPNQLLVYLMAPTSGLEDAKMHRELRIEANSSKRYNNS